MMSSKIIRPVLMFCSILFVVLLTASTCNQIPDPERIPVSSVLKQFLTTSNWFTLVTEPTTDRCHLLVCRYQGQTNWVLKQDNGYQLFNLKNGNYKSTQINLDSNQVATVGSSSTRVLPSLNARFINVDKLKNIYPDIGVLILDNGEKAFYIDMQGENSITLDAYVAFRMGALVLNRELSLSEVMGHFNRE